MAYFAEKSTLLLAESQQGSPIAGQNRQNLAEFGRNFSYFVGKKYVQFTMVKQTWRCSITDSITCMKLTFYYLHNEYFFIIDTFTSCMQ